MNAEDIATYLATWAELNAQEVYGSPREYVNIHELKAQIRQIKEAMK